MLKATYDCMLEHIDPEYAAKFMSRFLVQHLEGKDTSKLIKCFFESFGFVGIKTAQYLVTNTTLLDEKTRKTLMDLTSRVRGPDRRIVFDLAEKTYGKDAAKRIIQSVGSNVGGGSLMSFFDVNLWDEEQKDTAWSGLVGVLRPDIVAGLPEDLLVLSRIIQTMEEASEIFLGRTISDDLLDNLCLANTY